MEENLRQLMNRIQPIEALRGTDKLSKVVLRTAFESLSEFYNSAKRCMPIAINQVMTARFR